MTKTRGLNIRDPIARSRKFRDVIAFLSEMNILKHLVGHPTQSGL